MQENENNAKKMIFVLFLNQSSISLLKNKIFIINI